MLDEGPFFQGTIADLLVGDFFTAGRASNHIYVTAPVKGAGLAAEITAELAEGDAFSRVYAVEPTGTLENDPNVTDKKFSVIPLAPTAVARHCGSSARPPSRRD